jgi:arylsulfatase
MTDIMFGEFAKYKVLPLDASAFERYAAPRPNLTAGRKVFTYTVPVIGIPDSAAPNLTATSYTINAEIEVPQGGAEGAIVSDGNRFGGWGLYLLKGKPVFTWNFFDIERIKWLGPEALTPGKHTIVYDFKYDGLGFATLAFNNMSGLGRSGTGTLAVDGKIVATKKMERTVPLGIAIDPSFDIGSKTNSSIDDQDYQPPFTFTGKIAKITISVEPPVLTDADKQRLIDAARSRQDAK